MSHKIDTFNDNVISLDDAAEHVSAITGKKKNRRIILRWISRGLAGVRLDAIRIGGELFTSEQALNHFLNESHAARFRQDPVSKGAADPVDSLAQQATDLGI